MIETEVQREVIRQVIKQTISRIKQLQVRLEEEKKDRKEMGHYSDCGEFYREQVVKTEAILEELVRQKISLEKWRNKLKYQKV
jgi:hypothetical protein